MTLAIRQSVPCALEVIPLTRRAHTVRWWRHALARKESDRVEAMVTRVSCISRGLIVEGAGDLAAAPVSPERFQMAGVKTYSDQRIVMSMAPIRRSRYVAAKSQLDSEHQ